MVFGKNNADDRITVCVFLVVQAFNPSCSGAYDLTLGVIGGSALGSKAYQKKFEKSS